MPQARGRLGARTTILAAARRHFSAGGNLHPGHTPVHAPVRPFCAHQAPVHPPSVAETGSREVVAQITATTIPPSMNSSNATLSP